ncbi:oxidoreductase [Ktedonobacteria bacterium brp13]|nr:oxidoreductase [Ktedonobacteria bacterium brp13]
MVQLDPIRVGLIGYGFGKVYANALRDVALYYADLPPVELVAVATSSVTSGKLAAEQLGIEHYTTDYRELLASDDINTVVIATPPYLHREMLLAALATDKAIYTDKPLANNLLEAQEIVTAACARGRDAQISFTLRYCPAVQYVRQLLQAGRLGKVYTFRLAFYRASYRNPEKPLRWKAEMAKSGGGVLSDLVPHLADLLIWLIGMPEQLAAQTRIFIPERPAVQGSSERVRVETDDHVIIQADLAGGQIGTIESGRLIAGAVSNLSVEIYGSEGSLCWNIMDPNYLYFADARLADSEQDWQRIPVTQNYVSTLLPRVDIPAGEIPSNVAAFADFLSRTSKGQSYDPGLEQGLRVQEVIEMAAEAQRAGTWIARSMP